MGPRGGPLTVSAVHPPLLLLALPRWDAGGDVPGDGPEEGPQTAAVSLLNRRYGWAVAAKEMDLNEGMNDLTTK